MPLTATVNCGESRGSEFRWRRSVKTTLPDCVVRSHSSVGCVPCTHGAADRSHIGDRYAGHDAVFLGSRKLGSWFLGL